VIGPHQPDDDWVVQRVSLRADDFRVTPSASLAAVGTSARYRVEGAYRLLGVTPGVPGNNDHLDVIVGAVHHRIPSDLVSRSSMELALDSRYDLGHVGPTLRGAFFELSAGYLAGEVSYDVPGVQVPADFDSALLARFGFGATLRGLSHAGSEAIVYYDHRHDEIVGGLVSRGLGSGAIGRFGADATYFFLPELGLGLHAEIGSAWMLGASLLFRKESPATGASEGER
jgi:hypothetical protein